MVRVQAGRKPLDDRAVVLGGNDPQLVNQSHRQRELYFNEMSQGLSAVLETTVSTCSTYHKKTHGERERVHCRRMLTRLSGMPSGIWFRCSTAVGFCCCWSSARHRLSANLSPPDPAPAAAVLFNAKRDGEYSIGAPQRPCEPTGWTNDPVSRATANLISFDSFSPI